MAKAEKNGKKKSILRAVKGLLFEETEEETPEKGPEQPGIPIQTQTQEVTEKPQIPSGPRIDQKMYEVVMKHIEGTGEALEKFQGLVASLKDTIPEEEALYKAALKVATQTGTGPQSILDAIKEQEEALEEQVGEFNRHLDDHNKEIEELSAGRKQKEETIKKLLQQIEDIKKKIAAINEESKNDELKITKITQQNTFAKASFDATVALIQKELEQEREKIKNAMKGVSK